MNNLTLNSTVLNILRVYATALVFFCHSTIIAKECFGFKLHGLWRLINTPAWGGVWMFLAIGGFLAAYGFDQRNYTLDKKGIMKYYKGRIIKVLIPTYIFLSLMYIFNMQEAQVKWTTILQWLTCTFQGGGAGIKRVGATWYVFILMWLYLLTPILLKWLYFFEEKHKGKEIKSYLRVLLLICGIGVVFRLGGVFLNVYVDDKTYYNWFYANVTGTIDLYLIGIIGERIMHFVPPIDSEMILKYRKYAMWTLIITTCMFLGNVSYQSHLYKMIGPYLFSLSSILIVITYSYSIKSNNIKASRFCDIIAPYTFMFYLWHSPLLGFVADKLLVENVYLHYFAMQIIGGMITAYIAFLMTKMNNGIIKTLQSI